LQRNGSDEVEENVIAPLGLVDELGQVTCKSALILSSEGRGGDLVSYTPKVLADKNLLHNVIAL
jgi:hypothetical protein